jgi:CDP-diacylglycerol--glycerol-3-phosphate 3-phosphatidyltransferase
MKKPAYYIINGITLYRVLAAPFLGLLILLDRGDLFKWLLALSFLTDAIDGFLARRFKVTSVFGARLDSIGDDLTVLVGIIGMIVFKPDLLRDNITMVVMLLALFAIQVTLALVRYGKLTTFHTYLAKLAAVLQGCFLILFFFLPQPVYPLFYAAIIVTALQLIEESIIILVLKEPHSNVKGLYWVLKKKAPA